MILTVLLAVTLGLGGCVSNKKYQQLQMEYQSTRDGLLQCNTESKSMTYMIADLKKQNEDLKKSLQDMKSTLDQSMANNQQGNVNIAKLVDEINASNKYIKELISAKSKSDSLNMALTNKLTRSLTNDELKDVDVKVLKGVVYISLADNMLFKSGSYEISDRAMETLSKIAKIIKDYSDYDVLVEGNTDNVPISRTNHPQQLGPVRPARQQRGAVPAGQLRHQPPRASRPAAVENTILSPTTIPKWASSVIAGPKSSSHRNSTSSLT